MLKVNRETEISSPRKRDREIIPSGDLVKMEDSMAKNIEGKSRMKQYFIKKITKNK